VRITQMTREEFEAEQAADAQEEDPEDLAKMADTYGRLGFFPLDTDLRAVLARSSDWVGGSYDTKTSTITIVGNEADSVIVHEFVHAIQDQHFGIDAYQSASTSDGYLAESAVVEGDAKLAEGRFSLEERYGVDLDQADWAKAVRDNDEGIDELLHDFDGPALFMAYPTFVYPAGILYCAHNLTGVTREHTKPTLPYPYAWSRENALFTDLAPTSTREVLSLGAAEPAIPVGLRSVPRALAGRVATVEWDSLGQWYTYLLFRPLDGKGDVGDVRVLAEGSLGDGALFVRDITTDDKGTLWASAWQDEDLAKRALAALWTLYDAKPDAREPRAGEAADGEPVWLERRGDRVVASKNVAPDVAPALADAALAVDAPAQPMSAHAGPLFAAWLGRYRLAVPSAR
jgi:hypothetical protein